VETPLTPSIAGPRRSAVDPPVPDPAAAPAPRVILHVDVDAFFASVEQRDHPEYRGRPLIVGADPQGGKGRGVVAAASYEARVYGVRSAMPISQAYALCPDGVYVPPRHKRYAEASARIMDLLEPQADLFEMASIDEAYMDVSTRVQDFEEARRLAESLQHLVRDREGLSVSVGVAHNKSCAKVASDARKPGGITLIRPEEAEAYLAPLPVRKLSGVGPRTSELLEDLGIRTCAELASAPERILWEAFGKHGARVAAIARGIDPRPVEPGNEMKSVGTEHTFLRDVSDSDAVLKVTTDLAHVAHNELRRAHLHTRTVTLKIRFEDFTTYTRSRSLAGPVADRAALAEVARDLVSEFLPLRKAVRLIGVRFQNLVKTKAGQTSLETFPDLVVERIGENPTLPPVKPPACPPKREWFF